MATVFEVQCNNGRRETVVKKLEVFTDSDWASEQTTRKSTAVIVAEGMRLHARSRGLATVALCSCEAEVVAASEGIKEALLLQEVLMLTGLGHYVIEVKVDSNAAEAFFHRRHAPPMLQGHANACILQGLLTPQISLVCCVGCPNGDG